MGRRGRGGAKKGETRGREGKGGEGRGRDGKGGKGMGREGKFLLIVNQTNELASLLINTRFELRHSLS